MRFVTQILYLLWYLPLMLTNLTLVKLKVICDVTEGANLFFSEDVEHCHLYQDRGHYHHVGGEVYFEQRKVNYYLERAKHFGHVVGATVGKDEP